jgi:hypothetical protein
LPHNAHLLLLLDDDTLSIITIIMILNIKSSYTNSTFGIHT